MMNDYYICIDDDMLDEICHRFYGKTDRVTEIVLSHEKNRHLTWLEPYFKAGTKIFLPFITPEQQVKTRGLIRIFD